MQEYKYLQLQPIDDDDDATVVTDDSTDTIAGAAAVSDIDTDEQDETIDLSHDDDEETLDREWDAVMTAMHDDPDN